MEILIDPEEMIMCPYNNSHRIRRNKMGFHLVKCKKNYPNARIVSCDFNVTHQIPEPEIQYHHQHCPNRKDVEITVYREDVLPHGRRTSIRAILILGTDINRFPVHNIPVETEDSWDDCDAPSYNPNEYCEKNNVLRKLDVESAAKKKNFHLEERNRIRYLEEKPLECETVKKQEIAVKHKKSVALPEMSTVTKTNENTPDAILDLYERIRLGANVPYNEGSK